MKTENTNICFAYYGDNKFLGWYSDSFGTLSQYPKLYGNSVKQIEIITSNFRHKISRLKETELGGSNPAVTISNICLQSSKDTLLQYKEIELRVVECPLYDGINPEYSRLDFQEWLKTSKDEDVYHTPNWIYADHAKVKEWSANEPTEFVQTIKVL